MGWISVRIFTRIRGKSKLGGQRRSRDQKMKTAAAEAGRKTGQLQAVVGKGGGDSKLISYLYPSDIVY